MILVFGAGISGLGVLELLESKGKKVALIDDKVAKLNTQDGIKLMQEEDIEYIVKSPGISFKVPFIQEAIKKNIPIYSEIDIAYEYMDKNIKIVSITGTNGKTTTVSKTYELLKNAGYEVELAGNVGNSFAKVVKDNKKLDYIVLELSSYQLENNPRVKSNIAGIINLTPDHLARYIDTEDYYNTKFSIYTNQDENDYNILNLDDENVVRIFKTKDIKSKTITVSTKYDANICVVDGNIHVYGNKLIKASELSLKGNHNLENMLFLIAVAKVCNVSDEVLVNYLKTASAIEHRMEDFFKKDNSVFINDSKGTNVDSTIKALNSYDARICLICGGEDKKVPLDALAREIKDKTFKTYIYGQNRFLIEEELKKISYNDYVMFETVDECIDDIKKESDFKVKTYFLYSPATASFDQFKNFEQRGRYFKEIVVKKLGDNNV